MTKQKPSSDAINPSHYKKGKFEAITIIEDVIQFYPNPHLAYYLGNTLKYLVRAPHIRGKMLENLRKAHWYLSRAIATLERNTEV